MHALLPHFKSVSLQSQSSSRIVSKADSNSDSDDSVVMVGRFHSHSTSKKRRFSEMNHIEDESTTNHSSIRTEMKDDSKAEDSSLKRRKLVDSEISEEEMKHEDPTFNEKDPIVLDDDKDDANEHTGDENNPSQMAVMPHSLEIPPSIPTISLLTRLKHELVCPNRAFLNAYERRRIEVNLPGSKYRFIVFRYSPPSKKNEMNNDDTQTKMTSVDHCGCIVNEEEDLARFAEQNARDKQRRALYPTSGIDGRSDSAVSGFRSEEALDRVPLASDCGSKDHSMFGSWISVEDVMRLATYQARSGLCNTRIKEYVWYLVNDYFDHELDSPLYQRSGVGNPLCKYLVKWRRRKNGGCWAKKKTLMDDSQRGLNSSPLRPAVDGNNNRRLNDACVSRSSSSSSSLGSIPKKRRRLASSKLTVAKSHGDGEPFKDVFMISEEGFCVLLKLMVDWEVNQNNNTVLAEIYQRRFEYRRAIFGNDSTASVMVPVRDNLVPLRQACPINEDQLSLFRRFDHIKKDDWINGVVNVADMFGCRPPSQNLIDPKNDDQTTINKDMSVCSSVSSVGSSAMTKMNDGISMVVDLPKEQEKNHANKNNDNNNSDDDHNVEFPLDLPPLEEDPSTFKSMNTITNDDDHKSMASVSKDAEMSDVIGGDNNSDNNMVVCDDKPIANENQSSNLLGSMEAKRHDVCWRCGFEDFPEYFVEVCDCQVPTHIRCLAPPIPQKLRCIKEMLNEELQDTLKERDIQRRKEQWSEITGYRRNDCDGSLSSSLPNIKDSSSMVIPECPESKASSLQPDSVIPPRSPSNSTLTLPSLSSTPVIDLTQVVQSLSDDISKMATVIPKKPKTSEDLVMERIKELEIQDFEWVQNIEYFPTTGSKIKEYHDCESVSVEPSEDEISKPMKLSTLQSEKRVYFCSWCVESNEANVFKMLQRRHAIAKDEREKGKDKVQYEVQKALRYDLETKHYVVRWCLYPGPSNELLKFGASFFDIAKKYWKDLKEQFTLGKGDSECSGDCSNNINSENRKSLKSSKVRALPDSAWKKPVCARKALHEVSKHPSVKESRNTVVVEESLLGGEECLKEPVHQATDLSEWVKKCRENRRRVREGEMPMVDLRKDAWYEHFAPVRLNDLVPDRNFIAREQLYTKYTRDKKKEFTIKHQKVLAKKKPRTAGRGRGKGRRKKVKNDVVALLEPQDPSAVHLESSDKDFDMDRAKNKQCVLKFLKKDWKKWYKHFDTSHPSIVIGELLNPSNPVLIANIGAIHGKAQYGLFAIEDIPAKEVLFEYTGLITTQGMAERGMVGLEHELDKTTLFNLDGKTANEKRRLDKKGEPAYNIWGEKESQALEIDPHRYHNEAVYMNDYRSDINDSGEDQSEANAEEGSDDKNQSDSSKRGKKAGRGRRRKNVAKSASLNEDSGDDESVEEYRPPKSMRIHPEKQCVAASTPKTNRLLSCSDSALMDIVSSTSNTPTVAVGSTLDGFLSGAGLQSAQQAHQNLLHQFDDKQPAKKNEEINPSVLNVASDETETSIARGRPKRQRRKPKQVYDVDQAYSSILRKQQYQRNKREKLASRESVKPGFSSQRSVKKSKKKKSGAKKKRSRTINVRFREVMVNGWPHIYAVAERDIQKGEELLTDYGSNFWQNFSQIIERQKNLQSILKREERKTQRKLEDSQFEMDEKDCLILDLAKMISDQESLSESRMSRLREIVKAVGFSEGI